MLGAGAAAVAAYSGLTPIGAAAAAASKGARSLALDNSWTGEKLRVTYYENGAYNMEAMRALDHLMRDHVSNTGCEMQQALYDLLFELRATLGTSEPFLLVSGYRSPVTNAMLARKSRAVARNSFHLRGWAADVRVPGRDLRRTALAAVSLQRGGVGMYSRRSDFIHVDVGPVRRWNV
jgi:uncharacterized protein YcbK (DUF882 family)